MGNQKTKIDEIDTRILKTLTKDARTTFTQIANDLKISIENTRIRYKNLKKTGIITGATTQILPSAIGINCSGLIRIKTSQQKEETVQEYLNQQPYILATWKNTIEYNLTTFFALPNLKSYSIIMSNLKNKQDITALTSQIFSNQPYYEHPQNLLITPVDETNNQKTPYDKKSSPKPQDQIKPANKKNFIQTIELGQMNKTNRQIAKTLVNNARTPFSKIAKQHKISINKVKRTYQKLNKTLFGKSTITVNFRKLGYDSIAQISVELKSGINLKKLYNKMLQVPNVVTLCKIINENNLLIIVPLKTFRDLFEIRKQLLEMDEVKKIEDSIVEPFPSWPPNFFGVLI